MHEILLVEDNPADAYLTCDVLAGAAQPCHVTVVTDGAQAIASLRENCGKAVGAGPGDPRPEPAAQGRPRCPVWQVKSAPLLRKTPVVVFTTSQAEADIERSYELGANCYLRKPGNLQ